MRCPGPGCRGTSPAGGDPSGSGPGSGPVSTGAAGSCRPGAGVARLSWSTPHAASSAPVRARSTPPAPPLSRSPRSESPISAAATGLARVTTASGAPRPPRYAVWDSSSPPVAKAATSTATPITWTLSSGPERSVTATVTVWVSAEATPDAMPDAVACRSPGRAPGHDSTPISAAVAPDTVSASGTLSTSSGAGPDAVSSSAPRPSSVSPVPRHSIALTLRPASRAPRGTAATRVSAPSGWTTVRGPYLRATTCSSAAEALSATAHHQAPEVSIRRGPASEAREASRSWATAAAA